MTSWIKNSKKKITLIFIMFFFKDIKPWPLEKDKPRGVRKKKILCIYFYIHICINYNFKFVLNCVIQTSSFYQAWQLRADCTFLVYVIFYSMHKVSYSFILCLFSALPSWIFMSVSTSLWTEERTVSKQDKNLTTAVHIYKQTSDVLLYPCDLLHRI